MAILFVENHAVFAQVACKEFLSGYTVDIVPSRAEALKAMHSGTYECVLLDYDLDDGKGDALVPVIRNLYPKTKIVAVSSHETGNTAILAAGAHAACSKMRFKMLAAVLAELEVMPGVGFSADA